MFWVIIYIMFVLLDAIVGGSLREPFYDREFRDLNTIYAFFDGITQNGNKVTKQFLFHDEYRNQSRRKREIVLIDEDFDKLPEHLVRKGWRDVEPEPDTTESKTESDKYITTEEGSGGAFVKDDSTTKHISTPRELHKSSDQQDTTAKQILTTEHLISDKDITLKHISTVEALSSNKPKTSTLMDNTIEGSGDDMDILTTITTLKEVDVIDDSKLMLCLNYTCDEQDIDISPGFTESLPEDTTLILSCSMKNRSKSDILQWYKTNGSESSLLQTSLTGNQTQFTVAKVKTQDSGTYVCLRWWKNQCCHKQLDVTIYKKPNYKYHILIVGLVAAVSLFTCLLLSIHRNYKIKQFKKQLNTQIPLNEFLL